jgi:hypothetical protein
VIPIYFLYTPWGYKRITDRHHNNNGIKTIYKEKDIAYIKVYRISSGDSSDDLKKNKNKLKCH